MKRQLIIYVLVSLASFQVSVCQELKQELEGFYKSLYDAEKFHIAMEVSVFEKAKDDRPVVTKTYTMKRNGRQFRYSLDGAEYLFNDRCVLMINETGKYLHYSEREKNPKKVQEAILPDLDSLVRTMDSSVYKGVVNGEKMYTIFNHDGVISVMDLYFDVADSRIRKMVYFYNQEIQENQEKVEVSYTRWDSTPDFRDDEFSERQYIIKTEEGLTVADAYRGYLLIENE